VDAIGGDRGADVQGVLGVQGFIFTPHGSGMIGQLIEGVRIQSHLQSCRRAKASPTSPQFRWSR